MLTTGADTIVGMVGSNGTTDNSGDDIIVGTNTTLTAGDNLNGGNGEDVLRVYSDAAKNYAGFELSNIETLQVTADGAQQTFELSGATGLETLVSRNSSQTAVFQQLTTLANLSLDSLTGASNATVQYQDSVVAGAADAVVLTVNNSNAGVVTLGSVGDPNGGIETVNVVATGADTKIATLDTDLTTLNFSGDKNVTITNALNNTTKTIDATGSTGGGLTVGIGAGNANNVTFTGGKGDDQVTFATGTLNVNDQVTGGDGNDRIVADQADLIAARTKISGVEYIRVQSTLINNVADAANVLDASDFADATRFELANGYNTARIDNLNATQQRVDILQGIGGGANVGTLTIDDGATAATNDQFTLALGQDKVNNSVVADVDFVSGTIESVNLISNGDGATAGGAHTLNLLNTLGGNTNVHTLNITGVEGLTVTTAGSKVTTVAAGDATGDLDLTGVVYSATANATITTGSGNDTVTGGVKNDTINVGSGNDVVNASTGADGITLGDGIDRVIYTALNQSNSTGTDTIADFVNKTDIIDISGLGATAYAGTKATFDLAQGALAGGGLVSSVFDASNSRFWVDVDGNGTLDGNDLRVNLAGVTTLDAASVVTAAGVNAVNLTGNVTIATDTGNINVPGFAGGYATVAAAQAAGVQSFVGNNTNQLRLNASAEAAPVAFNMTTGVLTAGTGAQVNNVLYRGVQTADVSSAVADTVTVAAVDVATYTRAVLGSNGAGDIVRVGAGNYGTNLALTDVDVVEFSGVGGNFSITTTEGANTNVYQNQAGQALGTVVINAGAETSEAVTVNLLNGIAAAAYTGSAQATFDGGWAIDATTGDGIDTIVVNSFDKGGNDASFVLALNGGSDNVTVVALATADVDADDFQINGGNGTDSLSVALTNNKLRCPTFSVFQRIALMLPCLADPVV